MSYSKKRNHSSSCAKLQIRDDDFTDVEYKSKTQKKKEALALQVLGEKLLKLSPKQLENIDLPAEIYDAVQFAKTTRQHGALKRQMQYIGALMRQIDPAPIQEALDNIAKNKGSGKNSLKH